jgi:Arc/MetJ-type ribon-helix-helix transcriptional regulator
VLIRTGSLEPRRLSNLLYNSLHSIINSVKTIQMTIDEKLLNRVDAVIRTQRSSRSAFIRGALQAALKRHTILELEKRHAAGYADKPENADESLDWVAEQCWGEE